MESDAERVEKITRILFFYNHENCNNELRRRQIILRYLEIKIRRQRKILQVSATLLSQLFKLKQLVQSLNKKQRKKRSCGKHIRNKGWWATVSTSYNDERFKQAFRVSRTTFEYISQKTSPLLLKEETGAGTICPEERLAIALYKIGRGDYNYTIGEMTGYAESTISLIIREVCQVIIHLFWEEYVMNYFPKNTEEFRQCMINMETEWQFRFAFSAIDGSHLPIKCPNGGPESMKQYHNFKNFYSVVLFALVDAKYRFIWAAIGAPGNTHDSMYFQSTSLYKEIIQGKVLPKQVQKIGEVDIPPMILGDGAFPMKPWLCKPHGDAVLSDEKRYYNYRLSRARMVSEGAFGKFKSRFRVFHRKCESSKESVKVMGLASVVLHNLCLELGDMLPRSMDLTVDAATNKRRDRDEVADILNLTNRNQKNYSNDKTAKGIRNSLTSFFWNEKQSQ